MPRVLVIGFGNPLRRDDGAGWRVVESIGKRWEGRVVIRLGQQLVPEWAPDMADADVTFLVDASSVSGRRLRLQRLARALDQPFVNAHVLGPEQLLGLAELVSGKLPAAYLLEVPATDFEFGEDLSPAAAAGIEKAIRLLDRRLASVV